MKEELLPILKYTLHKREFAVSHQGINERLLNSTKGMNLSMDKHLDHILNSMIYTLNGFIWGEKLEPKKIQYPRDWFQAFKERWYPKRLLRRWPVLLTTHLITAYALYPDFRRAMPNERSVMDIIIGREDE